MSCAMIGRCHHYVTDYVMSTSVTSLLWLLFKFECFHCFVPYTVYHPINTMYNFAKSLLGRGDAAAAAGAERASASTASHRIITMEINNDKKALSFMNNRMYKCMRENHRLESAQTELCQQLEESQMSSRAAHESLKDAYYMELNNVRGELGEKAAANARLRMENDNLEETNKRFNILF